MNVELQQLHLVKQLEAKGIRDRRVLDAIGSTRRELFVPQALQKSAYEDTALPIGEGQTISQPFIVALMTEALQLDGTQRVLEIGTGSGYQAAVLSRLCARVITVERIADLSRQAQAVLTRLGYDNIEFHVGDGSLGWPDEAPYDGIVVTATAPKIPDSLYEQLKLGGRLVIPVGTQFVQSLQQVTKQEDRPQIIDLCNCRFVPLIGQQGWTTDEAAGG